VPHHTSAWGQVANAAFTKTKETKETKECPTTGEGRLALPCAARYWPPVGVVTQFLAYTVALSLFARRTLNLISATRYGSSEQDNRSMQGDLAIRVLTIRLRTYLRIAAVDSPPSHAVKSVKSVQSRGGTDFISTLLLQIEDRARHLFDVTSCAAVHSHHGLTAVVGR
jgi:hypothetical protein